MKQGAGGIIINDNGEVLIVEQRNSWSLPKGGVEHGETIFDAARREIEEETGIPKDELIYLRPLGSVVRNKIAKDGNVESEVELRETHYFLFHTSFADTLQPTDMDNPSACWLSPEAAIERLTHPKDKEFLRAQIGSIK